MSTEASVIDKPIEVASDVNAALANVAPAPSNMSRKELVDTAVRFLQNPKVVPTPITNKRAFLAKKGLTDEEIETALRSAGAYDVVNTQQTIITPQMAAPPLPQTVVVAQQSSPSLAYRIFKLVSNIIFAGCVAFTAYKLIVKRFFLKTKSKTESNLEKMLNDNNKLQETIKEMRDSLDLLKQSVESISGVVKQLNTNRPSIHSSPSMNETDLKTEVQSIKSLLLNRSQFPPPPTVATLPAWQLESKAKKSQPEASTTTTTSDLSSSTLSVDLNKSINNDTVVVEDESQ